MEMSACSEAYIVQRVHENEARKGRVKEGGIHVGVGSRSVRYHLLALVVASSLLPTLLARVSAFGSRLVMCVMLLCT